MNFLDKIMVIILVITATYIGHVGTMAKVAELLKRPTAAPEIAFKDDGTITVRACSEAAMKLKPTEYSEFTTQGHIIRYPSEGPMFVCWAGDVK